MEEGDIVHFRPPTTFCNTPDDNPAYTYYGRYFNAVYDLTTRETSFLCLSRMKYSPQR